MVLPETDFEQTERSNDEVDDIKDTVVDKTRNYGAEKGVGNAVTLQPLISDEVNDAGKVSAEESTARNDGLPIDRGWAWMVLLGATIEMVIVVGMLKSSGIFFVAFQERFGSSSSMTSSLNTVENAVWSVSALLMMTVGMKFLSCRAIMMIGSVALCISYIISSRAENIKVLLLSYGAIQGFGMACMEPVSITMLGNYFEKRRGLANSIANSGGSFGGLVLAPLITTMFEYYGYSGAMLLCGVLFLHGFISGALFRSPTFYTDRSKTLAAEKKAETLLVHNENVRSFKNQHTSKSIEFIKEHISAHVIDHSKKAFSSESTIAKPTALEQQRFHRVRTYTDSEVGKPVDLVKAIKSLDFKSAEYIGGSQFDIPAVIHFETDSVDFNNSTPDQSLCKSISKLFDLSLFRNPVFVVFLIAAGILCTPHALCMIYIAPHAKDMGIGSDGIAQLLTVYSAVDMCSRIVIGAVSDKKWIRRSTIIGICSCTVGILSHLMVFYTSYGWFMFYAVIFGLIGGAYFTLYAVVIIDYLTLSKLQSSLGLTILLQAIIVSSSFAVLGILRDNTGSYIMPFHLLGALALVGGSLMLSLPLVERCYNNYSQ